MVDDGYRRNKKVNRKNGMTPSHARGNLGRAGRAFGASCCMVVCDTVTTRLFDFYADGLIPTNLDRIFCF
jgi:hypothetical protein